MKGLVAVAVAALLVGAQADAGQSRISVQAQESLQALKGKVAELGDYDTELGQLEWKLRAAKFKKNTAIAVGVSTVLVGGISTVVSRVSLMTAHRMIPDSGIQWLNNYPGGRLLNWGIGIVDRVAKIKSRVVPVLYGLNTMAAAGVIFHYYLIAAEEVEILVTEIAQLRADFQMEQASYQAEIDYLEGR